MVFHQPRAVETQGIGETEFIQRFMINLSLTATHIGGYGEFVKEINIHRVGASKINAASAPRQFADRAQAAILTSVRLRLHRVGKASGGGWANYRHLFSRGVFCPGVWKRCLREKPFAIISEFGNGFANVGQRFVALGLGKFG